MLQIFRLQLSHFDPPSVWNFQPTTRTSQGFLFFYSILPFLDLLSMVLRTCAVSLTRILLSGSASRGSAEEKNCPSRPTSVCCLFVCFFFAITASHKIHQPECQWPGPPSRSYWVLRHCVIIDASSMTAFIAIAKTTPDSWYKFVRLVTVFQNIRVPGLPWFLALGHSFRSALGVTVRVKTSLLAWTFAFRSTLP